jgi:hypothetical protein
MQGHERAERGGLEVRQIAVDDQERTPRASERRRGLRHGVPGAALLRLDGERVAQPRERRLDKVALESDDRDGPLGTEGPRSAGDPGHHRLPRDRVEELDRFRLQARSLPGREKQHRQRRR